MNGKQMNEICIVTTVASPPVDSKILFSRIVSLNMHVSTFLYTTTYYDRDYIHTVHV